MAQILSHAHVDVVLDGHNFIGWADEDQPVEFDTGEDQVEISIGADGGMYGTSTAMFGSQLTFRMAPTSPTTQWLVARKEEHKQNQINGNAIRIFNGTYSDPVQGRSARMEGGVLMNCPDLPVPGQTFEATFQFERVVGNADGAVFRRPLSNA